MPVTCWYYDVSELSDPARFSEGMAALPWKDRKEKVLRFRFEKDRLLCLGAGLLAAHALRAAGAEDLALRLPENGKPVLAARPDIHFNLSHSGTLAVCAVSDSPVGVDVEEPDERAFEIADRCFRPEELAWLNDAPDYGRAFLRLWTRKESFLKRSGDGLSVSLLSFSVLPGEARTDGIVWTEHTVMPYQIAVCTEKDRPVTFCPWQAGHGFSSL